jgi:hypothetical protein
LISPSQTNKVYFTDLEVQERACSILQLLKYVQRKIENEDDNDEAAAAGNEANETAVGIQDELWSLFDGELNPVAPKAQRKVPVPEGLDLDAWINDPPSEEETAPEEVEQPSSKSVFVDSPAMRSTNSSSFTYAMSSQNYSTGSAVYNNQQGALVGARKV